VEVGLLTPVLQSVLNLARVRIGTVVIDYELWRDSTKTSHCSGCGGIRRCGGELCLIGACRDWGC
jgi:hypothetical protein